MIGRSALALLAAGSSATALASGGPALDAYDDIDPTAPVELHALADVYLLHNFNQPASGRNQLREFDLYADAPSLGFLRMTVARRPQRFGFRVDAGIGDMTQVFYLQDPASAAHPDLARGLSHVEQAFVSLAVPSPRTLSVDVGKFGTPVGLEDNESLSNWNYSRSLLYSWAEPSLHTGARASWRVSPAFAAALFWVNGWNSNLNEGSDLRTLAASGSWTPLETLELVLVYMGGPERPPGRLDQPRSTFRNLLDAYAVCKPIETLSFALSIDYGNDRADGGVQWGGLAGYARLEARAWLALALRGEVLRDPQGFVTGTRQDVEEVTATLEVRRRVQRLLLQGRLEFREDRSTALVFESGATNLVGRQDTLTVALIAAL